MDNLVFDNSKYKSSPSLQDNVTLYRTKDKSDISVRAYAYDSAKLVVISLHTIEISTMQS